MIQGDPNSWPIQEVPYPFMGDEALYDPSSYGNYKLFHGMLTRGAYEQADRAWHAEFMDRLDQDAELEHVQLKLPTRMTHDTRGPKTAPHVIDESLLADLVEDFCPDAPMAATDRFLGPWADLWRRDLMRLSVAACAWWPWMSGGATPVDRYLNKKPRPDLPQRRAVKAVGSSPPMLYDPDWKPLLPLHPLYIQPAPTHGTPVRLTDGPIAGYVARVVPLEEGSFTVCALALPALPPLDVINKRLNKELFRLRRHERRANWETLLRQRGEVLYRLCASFCWELE